MAKLLAEKEIEWPDTHANQYGVFQVMKPSYIKPLKKRKQKFLQPNVLTLVISKAAQEEQEKINEQM